MSSEWILMSYQGLNQSVSTTILTVLFFWREVKMKLIKTIQSVKKAFQAVLLAAVSVTGGICAAQPYSTVYPVGDLIIGFTTGFGNDEMYDLGKESSLTNGKTWNLASLLTSYGNYSGIYWGVIGNGADSGTPRTLWTTTIVGSVPDTNSGNSAFEHENIVAGTLY